MAAPKKALLDFLYINSQYNTEKEMEYLRLDETLLEEIMNEKFYSFLVRYTNRALEDRVGKNVNSSVIQSLPLINDIDCANVESIGAMKLELLQRRDLYRDIILKSY